MKYLIVIFSLIVLTSCFNNDVVQNVFDRYDAIDSVLIGQSVVIQKDTLDIINRSSWDNTITLSNGVEYSYKYINLKLDITLQNKIDSIRNHYNKLLENTEKNLK